ncbi:hypothetical protein NPJ88_006590 [Halomonas elongata]|uniref:hypothetical protein n=1 Tax=Halomonas elongata TaxID=2746 RepID=UPI00255ACC09|nr:hypothetical protein [Halomonas elongata]MDL4861994.1 hypothetical protein [Halomonas elongata]
MSHQLSFEEIDAVEEAIKKAMLEIWVADIEPDTPISEILPRAEKCGEVMGRALAGALLDKGITAESSVFIRNMEIEHRDRLVISARRQFGPAGKIRKFWNERDENS